MSQKTQFHSFYSQFHIVQVMKPIYEGCMEKGVQHVTTQATAQLVSAAASSRSHANGKIKSSWNYANNCKNNNNNNNNSESSIDQQTKAKTIHLTTRTTTTVTPNELTMNPVKNELFAINKKKPKKLMKKSVPKWEKTFYFFFCFVPQFSFCEFRKRNIQKKIVWVIGSACIHTTSRGTFIFTARKKDSECPVVHFNDFFFKQTVVEGGINASGFLLEEKKMSKKWIQFFQNCMIWLQQLYFYFIFFVRSHPKLISTDFVFVSTYKRKENFLFFFW